MAVNTNEASPALLPLTSCCADPEEVGQWVGDPGFDSCKVLFHIQDFTVGVSRGFHPGNYPLRSHGSCPVIRIPCKKY